MAVGRRTAVLVVADDLETRALYVNGLLGAGYMVHAVASPDQAVPTATTTTFHIVILDSPLDEVGLAVAERLAALPRRPRLIAVTTRIPTQSPIELLFDIYLEKPCSPEVVVDTVRLLPISSAQRKDLLIVARDRIGIRDVLERFGNAVADLDVRLDLRRGERRARRSRTIRERRHAERRALHVDEWLQQDGWAFVPAANRS